ncbi:hypothetical protein V1478_009658 [Vespula squamosa]|uniref:Uncharacterized protein n=1 Tax=Vespula squamosa TaxID=30214 RepID=A0ABD2AT19_VESSQ
MISNVKCKSLYATTKIDPDFTTWRLLNVEIIKKSNQNRSNGMIVAPREFTLPSNHHYCARQLCFCDKLHQNPKLDPTVPINTHASVSKVPT